MLQVNVDEQEVKQLCLEKIEEMLKDVEKDLVFWSRKELIRRTCLSWNTILDTFFYDPRFPKHKVGNKWLFPADATKKFLLQWLSEQTSR
ncbi:group-specific protein [Bacillus sp. MRMR6]|uniref:group-specific protein n=1 Tax=Bacillus sp. MRMR6 TaxID=1928617 RepID=UPI000952E24D|nr:group-specific protein [Bacillus sp. MRMR6]OLS39100.1 group-specific protein [Bacillus sp. MRMR6]